MKKKELKKLTKDQAIKNIDKLKKDLFNFRFQKVNSQITNPSKINETKKTPITNQADINAISIFSCTCACFFNFFLSCCSFKCTK